MHEFAIGGLVYCLEAFRPKSRVTIEVLYSAALLTIITSVFYYTDVTPFPGQGGTTCCSRDGRTRPDRPRFRSVAVDRRSACSLYRGN